MNRWITDGTEPPPSAYPRLDQGTLVPPDKLKFPKIPSVNVPAAPHKAYRADYGPDFISKGVVSQEPPRIGRSFPMFVPQVDADGNEVAGIRVPELAVPLATYTGWNLFNERSGPPEVVSSMQGSFIPFPRTREDRARTNDPRRSIDERYRNREQYLEMVAKAAIDLVEKGYLLKADVPRIIEQTGTRWDYATSSKCDDDSEPRRSHIDPAAPRPTPGKMRFRQWPCGVRFGWGFPNAGAPSVGQPGVPRLLRRNGAFAVGRASSTFFDLALRAGRIAPPG
jgi:hypothetical protein